MASNNLTTEKIIGYTTIAGSVFFVASILYAYCYYTKFNIDIFNYISISEIAVNYLDKTLLLLFCLLAMLLFVFLFHARLERYVEKQEADKEKKKIQSYMKALTVCITFLLILLAFLPTTSFYYKINLGIIYLLGSVGCCSFLTLLLFFPIFYGNNKEKSAIYAGVFIFSFFMSTYLLPKYEVEQMIRNHGRDNQYEILFRDNTLLKTSDSVFYIGKTLNYVFIHHYDKTGYRSRTSVINASDVKEINILGNVGQCNILP
jgi:hypothetical protein